MKPIFILDRENRDKDAEKKLTQAVIAIITAPHREFWAAVLTYIKFEQAPLISTMMCDPDTRTIYYSPSFALSLDTETFKQAVEHEVMHLCFFDPIKNHKTPHYTGIIGWIRKCIYNILIDIKIRKEVV